MNYLNRFLLVGWLCIVLPGMVLGESIKSTFDNGLLSNKDPKKLSTFKSQQFSLYDELKSRGDVIPEDLHEAIFGARNDNNIRTGGDGADDATIITYVAGGEYTDTGNTTANSDAVAATDVVAPANCSSSFYAGSSFGGPDTWYTFTLPEDASVSASTCDDAAYDTCLGIFDESLTLVAVNDDGAGCLDYSSLLPSCSLSAGTYYLVVDSWGVDSGDYGLTVNFQEPIGPCEDYDCTGLDEEGEGWTMDDTVNGGCISDPNVWMPLDVPGEICGTFYTYNNGETDSRDTDWYEVLLFGDSYLTVEAFSCATTTYSVALYNGTCDAPVQIAWMDGDAFGEVGFTSECLPAGTYWVIVLPNVFTGISEETAYYLNVSVTTLNLTGTIATEPFNHAGSLPADWTVDSQSRSTPWTPILESGDDWAVESSHTAFDTVFDELLISPVYDLSLYEDVEVGFTQNYSHAGSVAEFRYSTTGGLAWSTFHDWTANAAGETLFDISTLADGNSNMRFAFRFRSDLPTNGASWRLDDFLLLGTPIPPVASIPVPAQPPEAWINLTNVIGCKWDQALGVDGNNLHVRVDENGDGDYLDGGIEDWQALPIQPDSTSLDVLTEVTLSNNGIHYFELRAKTPGGNWGYSGTSGIEGLSDDWFVLLNVPGDTDYPAFSDYLPIGQPDPAWVNNLTINVGVTVSDAGSGVNADSMFIRVDWDGNGSFAGGPEDWVPLTGYTSGNSIDILENLLFAIDDEYQAQFWTFDQNGNQAVSEVVILRVDTTSPTASTLFHMSSGQESLTFNFSPTVDDHFARYELAVSTDSLVDESDQIWTDTQDPALAEITTFATTVTGLQQATRYWTQQRAVDLAGNTSEWSNRVTGVTEGAPLVAVSDLIAGHTPEGVLLSWTPPVEDVYGGSPVVIEGYDIHASTDPWFTPSQDTYLAATTDSQYLIPMARTQNIAVLYRVVVRGAGPGLPPTGTIIAWGENYFGECNFPEPNTGFLAFEAADDHCLGLKADGSIIAWGKNDVGQCNVPVPNTGFIAVATGSQHSLGLLANGSIVAWGRNNNGQCNIPAPNTEFVALAAGSNHSLGLKTNGSIVAWGKNSYGQCNVPAPNSDYVSMDGGDGHSLGLKVDGSVVAWGWNYFGQCDVPLPNLGFEAISSGNAHCLGLKADNSIVAWGNNQFGQCDVPEPCTGFVAIATGIYHSLGLKAEGSLEAWGHNTYGQCNVPAPDAEFMDITCGWYHCLVLKHE
jgi:chitodextrinase